MRLFKYYGPGVSYMQRVAFRAQYPDEMLHPFHRRITTTDGVGRAKLLMWGPMSTVSTLTWFDASSDVVADVFEVVESTTATELVPGDGGTYAFVHQAAYEFPDVLLELVAESRVVYLPPISFFEDGRVAFEVAGQSDYLAAFHERLADFADVTIEHVREFDRWGSPATLTDRQAAALDAAVDLGYYDVPRSGGVTDVAERLDCSSSTAGELLRRAEASVIRTFADGR